MFLPGRAYLLLLAEGMISNRYFFQYSQDIKKQGYVLLLSLGMSSHNACAKVT